MLPNFVVLLGALASTAVALPAAEPVRTVALQSRAVSCTFKTLDEAVKGKAKCDKITLDNISVPAGKTLDMSSLKKGANVSNLKRPGLSRNMYG